MPNVGPPPPFDAYSAGGYSGAVAQPPAAYVSPPQQGLPPGYLAAPYAGQTIAPAPHPPFPQSSSSEGWFSGEPPIGWESGTYSIEGIEAAGVRFTKFVQQLDGEYTHLSGGGGASDLQLDRVEVSSTFAWPLFGNLDTPLLLTPAFVYNRFEDGLFNPVGFPGETYEAYLDAAWLPAINDWLRAELGIRTGVWSDFNESSSESIRVLGRGAAAIRVSPSTEILAGVVYLDRERVKLLPIAGVRWRPSPDVSIDAVFPNPVARRRLQTNGATDWWVFVAGEYGGGSWVVEQVPEGFDYNDIRVSLGLEFETPRRVTGRFEVGYVFERELFLSPNNVVFGVDDTWMLRAGINL